MPDPGFVGFRAAPAVCRRLDELAEARGLNRSSAIRAAILEATVPEHATAIADKHEVLVLLTEAARGGNVAADEGAADPPLVCRGRLLWIRSSRSSMSWQPGVTLRTRCATGPDELGADGAEGRLLAAHRPFCPRWPPTPRWDWCAAARPNRK